MWGGCGGLGVALQDKFSDINIRYTCIDPDKKAIESGRENFPSLKLIEGCFPEDMPKGKRYDMVTMFALFPQIPDWKEMLLNLSKFSKRYINISIVLRMEGPTIIDNDTSYVYYLDTGERVHQVVHNVYEFINFCCIKEMRAKRISFYGYHKEISTTAYRPLPEREQIRGNVLIELLPENENIKRIGGISNRNAFDSIGHEYHVFTPKIKIIIDKKRIDL